MRRFVTGLVISAGCLWWAFRGFDWLAVKETMLAGNIWLISLAAVLLLSSIPIRGYRWSILLKPIGNVSIKLASEASLVGYFGNNALPFRLGELLRSYFLANQSKLGMSKIFGTVIVERVIDTIGFVIVLAILPFLGAIPAELLAPIKWAMIIGGVLGMATLLVVKLDKLPLVSGKLAGLLNNLKQGFHGLREGHHYLPLALTTVVIWALYIASAHAALTGMNLQLTLSQSYLVLVTASLAMSVPAAPGFVGTYHAGVIFVLMTVFGIELATSQATAIMLHAVGFVPYTLIGAYFYFKSHINTAKLRAVISDDTEAMIEEV